MPRTIVEEKTVYKFDELSDSAKETAREWMRRCASEDFDYSATYDDAAEIAKLLGIDLMQRPVKLMSGVTRYYPAIYFRGFSSQGDGATFEGAYAYVKGSVAAVKAYAPQDSKLHEIAESLAAAQRKYFYRLRATVKHSGHYYNEYSNTIEIEDSEDSFRDIDQDTQESIKESLRDFMRWIYRQLESEYEYRLSDEWIDATIRINEYEFSEDGKVI